MFPLAGLMAVGCAHAQPPIQVDVTRTVTVLESEEDVNFPWAFRGPGDFLALGSSIGQHTVTERGQTHVSEDDGETWRPAEGPVVGGMGTLLADGRAAHLSCGGPEPNDDGAYPVSTLYFANGGRASGETVPGFVTLPFRMKPHFHRSLVEMPDGGLLATIYGTQEGHSKYTSALIRTDDGGRNWRFLSVIAHSEEIGVEGFCEPVVVRLANGDLLCAMRVGGPLHLARSTDEGRTWDEPQVVADHGVDPDLLLMKSGVLVLSYGRPNVGLRFSADGTGEEWTEPLTLYRGMGCSYTSIREARNGELMVFFSQSQFCGKPGPGPLNMIRLARLSVSRR